VSRLVLAAACQAQAAELVHPADLRPGLVATYRDGSPRPVAVVRLEPTLALVLDTGEAPHPRLAPEEGTVRWQGYLSVLRAGSYRFRARVRGRFRLAIGSREVLSAEATTESLREGPEVRLEPGPQPLVAEFTRVPGAAQLEVSWQGPGFHEEPLPGDALRHLPRQRPEQLAEDAAIDQGRFLVEEHACAACHRPAANDRPGAGLAQRQGPDLSAVGSRVHAGWTYRWLEEPQQLRPGAVMPQMFSDDEAGRAERYAVARYLASLGGPAPHDRTDPRQTQPRAERGRRLFAAIGCTACHPRPEDKNAPPRENDLYPSSLSSFLRPPSSFPLPGLGAKTTPSRLAAYLQNPLAVDPSGRMPHMLLQGHEALDLATYLCQDGSPDRDLPAVPNRQQFVSAIERIVPGAERQAFARLPEEQRWLDLGQRLVIHKGCAHCHRIAPGGKPLLSPPARASFADLTRPIVHDRGCLATDPLRRGAAPRFGLKESERGSIRRFLAVAAQGPGSPAPAHAARVTLERFNCLACHSRDGEGGLTPELVEELRRYEKAENAEAVTPPPLTGVGHKLRTPWLRQVLTQAARARPWMGLRMPQFGEANVGRLPEGLAILEGTRPDDRVHAVSLSPATIEAGRRLVGKNAFGCISCHDLAGIPNHGTRGPDLASMNQRVRYDWYLRWLEQPQRMQPGTRMPGVFSDGTSPLPGVLRGSAVAQAEAMWAYLSLGPNLPLPEGLEPPRGLVLTVKDRPTILRTFLPEAGTRAIAVGYPGGISVAFDAATCRLAYAWSGNFLDASGVWNDRGGSPARLLGARFWTAPPGCPWAVAASPDPPDFSARLRDPAYGAHLPEGEVDDGPRQIAFHGYTTDPAGRATFRYRIEAASAAATAVSEQPRPLHSRAGHGVRRELTVTAPSRHTVWLLAGRTGREPRLIDDRGTPQALDLKKGNAEVVPAGRRLVLPQEGVRALVLALPVAPSGARWQLRRTAGGWEALVRLPAGAGEMRLALDVWAPYRDDPALLHELVTTP
jgi:mono/diheme cytochrome c family protein